GPPFMHPPRTTHPNQDAVRTYPPARADKEQAVTRLIRQAAITAICDGTERITKTTLDTIRLDHLAEQHNRPTRNH
ncbi:hypothetical protein AB0G64_37465, partial [Streptomyces longwoodensis]